MAGDFEGYAEGGELHKYHAKEMHKNEAPYHPEDDGGNLYHEKPEEDGIFGALKKKKMAEGGMVDLEANSRESKNNEDDYSFEALEKEMYDDSQLSEQPMDSNEHGDESEKAAENEHDSKIVSAIRKKYKRK
jgi:hypothetical protein